MSGQDPSVDVANVSAAYVLERDDNARLRAAIRKAHGLMTRGENDRARSELSSAINLYGEHLRDALLDIAQNGGDR